MNTKFFFVAAAAAISTLSTLSAGSAFAGEATYEYPVAITSTVSRADVQAQTRLARAAGQISYGELSVVIADSGPALSRAQVQAELREAVRIGAISSGEQTVALTPAQAESIRMAGLKAAAMMMASR
jgi:TRAP-type C4-dicarboxylate transport system substrate-binding protein